MEPLVSPASPPSACVVDAKGITGSVALGDYEAVLLCNSELVGWKAATIREAPLAVDNEVEFKSLAPDMANLDLALAAVGAGA